MIVVLIAGASGTGKTTLSERLKEALNQLNISCQLLSMDNYYKERDVTAYPSIDEFRKQLKFYQPSHLHLEQLSKDIVSLSQGQPVFQKQFIFSTNLYQRDENGHCVTEKIEPSDIIILEGLFAQYFAHSHLPENCPRVSINISNSNYLNTLKARIKRDTAPPPLGRGFTEKQVRTNEFKYVGPVFFQYTATHASGSDIYILNDHETQLNDVSFSEAISEIISKITALKKELESSAFIAKKPIHAPLLAEDSQLRYEQSLKPTL